MYELLKRVKTRDAALLYCWMKNVAPTRRLSNVSLDSVAAWINADGLRTSRESRFTARVIRERLNELEEAGLIERVYDGNEFDVYVYNPEIADIDDADHDENGNENGNGNRNRNGNGSRQRARARNKEYIYKINKQINNQEGKNMREYTWEDLQEKPIQIDEPTQCQTQEPTPEDALRRINLSDEKIAKFRADVVKKIWEPDINPELIDRLVCAAVLKLANFNVKAAFNLCRAALDSRSLYDRTDGRAGKKHLWQTIGYSVKRIYEAAGYVWTPTRIGNEPAPEYRPIVPADPIQAVHPRDEVQTTREKIEVSPIPDSDKTVDGFTVKDLNKPLNDFEREVRERLNTRPGFETKARALEIRNSLRGFVELASELSAPEPQAFERSTPRPRATSDRLGAF